MKKQWLRLCSFEVAGVVHHNAEFVRDELTVRALVVLVREAENEHDANAVELYAKNATGAPVKIGYVPRATAALLAPLLDAGVVLGARVSGIELAGREVPEVSVQCYVAKVNS